MRLTVVTAAGATVGSGVVDRLGSLVVRNLTAGPGYRFEEGTGPGARRTAAFRVLGTTSTPGASFYSSQHLHAGLNYVRMRDGILLAATVRLPPGKTLADGPFPTVIEYSGYNVAGPHGLIDALEGQASSSDPLLPDTSTVVGSVVAPLLGFVTVSVQIRGTGCSGGAFDLFGLPSDYDGYDVVQTVGAQPWVLNHKVGMVGISYSGFSQLVVAGTDPPDLAAITPLSPTDDLYSTGYPGGIYNDGFAASWVAPARARTPARHPEEVNRGRRPRSRRATRRAWPTNACIYRPRVSTRSSSPNLGRTPALFNPRSPTVWASHIKVPVFMVGALEDEQVGPQWPALITALHGDKDVYVTMMNGTHTDSLGPDTISRWLEFLDLYVADRVPTASPTLDALAPTLYSSLTGGAASAPVPAVRFTTEPSVTQAKAAFAAQDPRVRVLFDNGGGALGPGALQPTYEAGFSAWPPAGTVVHYALGPNGTLQTGTPPASTTASFHPNPAVRPADDLPASANAWAAQPPYDWTTVPAANGIAFETPAFTSATTIVGPASLDLMLRSTAPVTDLQVTVTEVRPGATQEEYVTSGFLRSSDRTQSGRVDRARPRTDLSDGRSPIPPARALHPGADSGRPHCAHLPRRDAAAHRHFRARRGPAVVDLRHAGHPRCRRRHGVARRHARLVAGGQRGGRRRPVPRHAGLRRTARRALPGLCAAGQPGLTIGRPSPALGRVAAMAGTAGDEHSVEVSLYQGLLTTRAIRRYTDEPVPDEALRDILFAATRAPSGSNRQPFRFIVLTDGAVAQEAKRLIGQGARRFWAAKREADGYDAGSGAQADSPKARMARTMQHYVDTYESVPVLVLACFRRYRHAGSYTDGASVYPACQNLLLAARALGFGGVMTSWQFAADAELRSLLHIPGEVEIMATITLGRPQGRHGPVRRRPLPELVYGDRWGESPAWAVDPAGTAHTSAGPPTSSQ